MQNDTSVFEHLESQVRIYCRQWPVVFSKARGSRISDEHGVEYLDFFAGAGTLNYGHNPAALRGALLSYISDGGITHSLDMHTESKAEFLTTLKLDLLAKIREEKALSDTLKAELKAAMDEFELTWKAAAAR